MENSKKYEKDTKKRTEFATSEVKKSEQCTTIIELYEERKMTEDENEEILH